MLQNAPQPATTHWQTQVPELWRAQLNHPDKGGKYLDEAGRKAMRAALDRGDFQECSDTAFIHLNRVHAITHGARWCEIETTELFRHVTPSPFSSYARDVLPLKKLQPITDEDIERIANRFPTGII